MGLINSAAESELIASEVENTGGVYFVPAFSGLLAPYWQDDARGTIVGLTGTVIIANKLSSVLKQCFVGDSDICDGFAYFCQQRSCDPTMLWVWDLIDQQLNSLLIVWPT